MRIVLTTIFLAALSAPALAQSTTATSGTTQPNTSAPATTNTMPKGELKTKIPPAARPGESGLRVGEGAVTGDPVEIKRNK